MRSGFVLRRSDHETILRGASSTTEAEAQMTMTRIVTMRMMTGRIVQIGDISSWKKLRVAMSHGDHEWWWEKAGWEIAIRSGRDWSVQAETLEPMISRTEKAEKNRPHLERWRLLRYRIPIPRVPPNTKRRKELPQRSSKDLKRHTSPQ